MLTCYNRGCGQSFEQETNRDESCRHHPGMPFFHDAYKGWSCCNKKSVDFTEFLNIKGCQLSRHSNVKPAEPEKPPQPLVEDEPPKVVNKPVKPSPLVRPAQDTQLLKLVATVAPALQQAIDKLDTSHTKPEQTASGAVTASVEIAAGTTCKHGGCGQVYESPASDDTDCVHHPGVPIFHEGLKFWSCCTKRTTDFAAFMNQKGCAYGKHKWTQDSDNEKEVNCRYDWHQTGSNVVIAIYAKLYHPAKSFVKVNPVRLVVSLVFPQQNEAEFNMDIELRGIIDVTKAKVQMLGTKVEITLPKAEPGTWSQLSFASKTPAAPKSDEQTAAKPTKYASDTESDTESDTDLDDIEQVRGVRITDA